MPRTAGSFEPLPRGSNEPAVFGACRGHVGPMLDHVGLLGAMMGPS